MDKVKIIAFIQARTTSTRFPGKIYEELNGVPILFHTIGKAKETKLINDVIVVSPTKLSYLPEGIEDFVYDVDEEDVLSRFYFCLLANKCDYVVRLTSDCPVLDPELIDFIIYHGVTNEADYCSNVIKLTFPDGVDAELVSAKLLTFLYLTVKSRYHREHVTSLVRDNLDLQEQFKCISVENNKDLSKIKLSVDTPEDLERLKELDDRRLLSYEKTTQDNV